MDQAKNFVCRSCSTPVPLGHKFCGRCGAAVPPEILKARTQFFGQLQAPGKAKLILIRGEGVEGLSYQLNAEQHIVGRNGQLVFPDDPFVSPKHANFFYRNGKLVVRDEGSLNGVYLRVRGTVDIQPGDHFLAGEQLFRLDATPKASDGPAPDGTYFYSSPKHQSPFRITQILQGGALGMTVCARGVEPADRPRGRRPELPERPLHERLALQDRGDAAASSSLTDMNSRNGTLRPPEGRARARPRRLPLHRPQAAARRDHRRLTRAERRLSARPQALRRSSCRRCERAGVRPSALRAIDENTPIIADGRLSMRSSRSTGPSATGMISAKTRREALVLALRAS